MYQNSSSDDIDQDITKIFNVVIDVEKYPIFLPWCRAVRIIKKSDSYIQAEMCVYFSMKKFVYVSDIEYKLNDADKIGYINITSHNNRLFKQLNSVWKFKENDSNKTSVNFETSFYFNSSITQNLAEKFYNYSCKKILQSFKERVNSVN